MGNEKEVEELLEEVEHTRSITTGIDALHDLVCSHKKMRIGALSAQLGVSKELALQWAKILEARGLVRLRYPFIGGIEVRKA